MKRAASGTIACVINPASAGGATAKIWDSWSVMMDHAGFHHSSHMTSSPGDAIGLTRSLLREGATTIVAVGGDGTINEVVNGFFEEGGEGLLINPKAALAVFPRGTGCDFRKSLGIPLDVEGCISLLGAKTIKQIDVGCVTFEDKEPSWRYFVNIADCGMGGAIVQKVNSSTYKGGGMRGTAVFLGISLQTLMTYPAAHVNVEVDGDIFYSGGAHNVVIANGEYFGGGMHIAPNARMDDGKFDVLVLAPESKFQALKGMVNVYNGTHLSQQGVVATTGSSIRITPTDDQIDDVLFDIEGEQIGVIPAHVNCLHKKLRIYVPNEESADPAF